MSDRRAVSAGHLAASSVAAAGEPWRVAVGGNRVESMTVEQIAQAFHAGQLNVRTPLWPPGTSGWQALGNFEQFQFGAYAPQASYAQLSQFEEADDDPTRMWTGSSDFSELDNAVAPAPPAPPMARASARTGPRQVSSRAPRSLPAPSPAGSPRTAVAAASPPLTRAARPRRGSGVWLAAGLVGLVGLGSAVLAARGTSSVAAPRTDIAAATPSPLPAAGATATPTAAPVAESPAPGAAPSAAPNAEGDPSAANQARLANYEVTQASAFAAEARPAATNAEKEAPEAKAEPAAPAEEASPPKSETAARAVPVRERTKAATRLSKRVAAAPKSKSRPVEAKVEPKPEPKVQPKVQSQPASAAVNEAAATALGNAAKLASSCRPRGGPSGPGKARVIYSQDGDVQSVEILTAKFRDTLTGSCVRMVFRRAKIPAFRGEPPTFIKSFTIPEE